VKMSPKFGFVLASVSLLTVAARCGVENQKAVDVVQDGGLPATIFGFANPMPSEASVNAYVGRDLNAELKVAVIDLGVDYNHPALSGKIALDILDNKVVSVGRDVMGDDAFAHPNLINPSLFAFGAKDVVDGLIIEPTADPIGAIDALNAKFMAQLTAAVQAHPVLKDSLFKNINEKSMSVLGAYSLIKVSPLDQSSYESAKKGEYLTNAKQREKAQEARIKADEEPELRFMLDRPWLISSTKGYPTFDAEFESARSLWFIEDADLFFNLLVSEFATFDAAENFSAKVGTYLKYQNARESANSQDAKQNLEAVLTELQTTWYKLKSNFEADNLVTKFAQSFCSRMVSNEAYKSLRDDSIDASQKDLIIENEMNRLFNIGSEANQIIADNRDTFGISESNESILRQASYPGYKTSALNFIQNLGGFKVFDCSDFRPKNDLQADYVKFQTTYRHPYLSQESASASHGTHVSGIIASQSKDISIVPVRVTTQSALTTPAQREAMKIQFKQDFSAWLMDPVVFKGIQDKFAPFKFEATDPAVATDSKRYVEAVLSVFASKIDEVAEESPLDLIFINDIVKAIEYVGQQKIKVANVSLGTSFASAPASDVPATDRSNVSSLFNFLRFEYSKTVVATALKKNAENTLFVIAAGNDGSWVDGKSRSALPCDLSSPYFQKFESSGQALPNNKIDNILCVGSIGPKDELSSFTNLTITDVPFVLSYGEAILSSIRTGDCQGNAEEFALKEGKGFRYPNFNDNPVSDALYEKLGLIDPASADENQHRFAARIVATALDKFVPTFNYMRNAASCYEESKFVGHMSGTSMATPAVAGYVGKKLAEELRARSLKEQDIWANPDFSPKAIVQRMFADAPKFGGKLLISDVPKIVDILPWNPSLIGGSKTQVASNAGFVYLPVK
jgi:subtilisin family serine protease